MTYVHYCYLMIRTISTTAYSPGDSFTVEITEQLFLPQLVYNELRETAPFDTMIGAMNISHDTSRGEEPR